MADQVSRVLELATDIQQKRADLEVVEKEFNAMLNGAKPKSTPANGEVKRGRGRPKGSGSKASAKGNDSPKRIGRPPGSGSKGKDAKDAKDVTTKQTPLTRLIPEILTGKGKAVVWQTHAEIVSAILETGYDSVSKDFGNVVYQTLRKQVRDQKLVYREEDLKFCLK